MARFGSWLLVALGFLSAASAYAHDPGLSSSHVSRTKDGIVVTMAFMWSDLVPLFAESQGGDRPSDSELNALGPELARATAGVVRLSVNGVMLPSPIPIVKGGDSSPDEVTVSLEWTHVASGALSLDFPMLGKLPFGHRTILSVGDSIDPVALLDSHNSTHDLPATEATATSTTSERPHPGWASFIVLGIEHILTGFDHLCFLLALLLVAVRVRDVFAVVTTFTVAHSLTLAAAATGLVSLSPKIVEPLIAASIVYIGIENVLLRRAPKYRLFVVFGFGLVHGLGFASALGERLPGVTGLAIIPPLLSFNAGVEIGQLAVAACLVPLIKWARSSPMFVPRWQPAFSVAIAAAGFVWLCQRI